MVGLIGSLLFLLVVIVALLGCCLGLLFLLFVGVVCFCYLVFVRYCLGGLFGVLFCWVCAFGLGLLFDV